MAIRTYREDDLDGTTLDDENHEPVTFTLNGVSFEIDLSPANEQKLTDLLAPFMAAARRVGPDRVSEASEAPTPSRARGRSGERPYKLNDARRWLQSNGHEVSVRGPVADEALRVYERAHHIPEYRTQ